MTEVRPDFVTKTHAEEVEDKLRFELLPYLVTADRLKKWRPLQIYTFYLYFGEFFVLLAGFGLANPVVSFLAGSDELKTGNQKNQTIIEFLGSGWAAVVGILLLLGWGILKFYVRKEGLEKRCSLLRSCIDQCTQFRNQIRTAIAKTDPMPGLIEIQQKASDLIDRNIIEKSWPYGGPEPGIQPEVNKECDELIGPFRARWKKGEGDRR